MSTEALFYQIPTSLIDTGDLEAIRQHIDTNEEFTAYDFSGYAFGGIMENLDKAAPLPDIPASVQRACGMMVRDGGYLACIPVTQERASHYQKILSDASWETPYVLEQFSALTGLDGEEARKELDHALEVLAAALAGADSGHVILILFAG